MITSAYPARVHEHPLTYVIAKLASAIHLTGSDRNPNQRNCSNPRQGRPAHSPFVVATAVRPSATVASRVERKATSSANASPQGRRRSGMTTGRYALSKTVLPFVSIGKNPVAVSDVVYTKNTFVRSADRPATAQQSVVGDKHDIVTPLDAEEWNKALMECDLLSKYPYLIHFLRSGFPIGDITRTELTSFTPPNSFIENPSIIGDWIAEEMLLRRMVGPFTQEGLEAHLGESFVSSPLSVVPKVGGTGWRVVRNFSKVDPKTGVSVNDLLDADDYPTTWGGALQMAEIVSTFYYHCYDGGVAGHENFARWPHIIECQGYLPTAVCLWGHVGHEQRCYAAIMYSPEGHKR